MALKTPMLIIGGGMVGMLAKHVFPDALVVDWRKAPPAGRAVVGVQLGAQYLWEPLDDIPHESFWVVTTIDNEPPTIESVIAYKKKIGKEHDLEVDYVFLMRQFQSMTGYRITPKAMKDLTAQMNVRWDTFIESIDPETHLARTRDGAVIHYDMCISTIPLPGLLEMVAWVGYYPPFKSRGICVKVTPVPPDAPLSEPKTIRVNYIADPDTPAYRTTDRDGYRHYEWLEGHMQARRMIGLPNKVIKPGKIWPHPYTERILETLKAFNIHPCGRFPRWDPDALLHQTYHQLKRLRA